mmetsp:Transcript_12535/g.35856  ORF Transcript_12535/g.35856 Transcript_12535/m.35856 type:complete len:252 (-) Transcript_12535:598-1353(-)
MGNSSIASSSSIDKGDGSICRASPVGPSKGASMPIPIASPTCTAPSPSSPRLPTAMAMVLPFSLKAMPVVPSCAAISGPILMPLRFHHPPLLLAMYSKMLTSYFSMLVQSVRVGSTFLKVWQSGRLTATDLPLPERAEWDVMKSGKLDLMDHDPLTFSYTRPLKTNVLASQLSWILKSKSYAPNTSSCWIHSDSLALSSKIVATLGQMRQMASALCDTARVVPSALRLTARAPHMSMMRVPYTLHCPRKSS